MTVKAGYLTPLLHVADVERSLRFYALLGFDTVGERWRKVTVAKGDGAFIRAAGISAHSSAAA